MLTKLLLCHILIKVFCILSKYEKVLGLRVFCILSKYEKVLGLKVFFNQYHSFTLFFKVELHHLIGGTAHNFPNPTRGSMPRTSCLSFE